MDFRSHYEDKKDDILENERKYSQNATEIDEAIDDLSMDPACMGPSSSRCSRTTSSSSSRGC